MTVLYIIDSLKGYGAEKSIVEIVTRFNRVKPVFVLLYKGNDFSHQLLSHKISVYALNINSKYSTKIAVNRIIPIVQKENPDIIHSTLFQADLVARKLKSKFPEIPLVGSFVSNSYSQLRFSQLNWISKLKLISTQIRDSLSINKVDYFISNSHTLRKTNSVALRVPLSKITTIYRGREIRKRPFNPNSQFPQIPLPDLKNKICFLNVGRLQKSKGQLDLIRAFKLLHDKFPDSVLIIAGNGNFLEELRSEIRSLELSSSVFLLGYVDEIDALLYYTNFFIFPSYFEGLPGGIIEAMLAKKPCLVSDIPEIKECFPENTALFFQPGDINGIYHVMQQAINFPNWKDRIERSHDFATMNFDIEIISKKYEDFYLSIKKGNFKTHTKFLIYFKKNFPASPKSLCFK